MVCRKTIARILLGCCLFLALLGIFGSYVAPSNILADDVGGIPLPPYHSPDPIPTGTPPDTLSI